MKKFLDVVLNSKNFENGKKQYQNYGLELDLGDITQVYVSGYDKKSFKIGGGAELIFCFDNCHSVDKNGRYLEPMEIGLPIGYKTPKGYFSTKMLPVVVANIYELTELEVEALLEFYTDAKKNTYDPFYFENEAKRRNASAWNYIAANYITDPYCTR
jgi:hypothetical protein